ncbi:carboxylating nicotinate-nucleotide diphosphorylase [Litorihabitans aurantiacus]|uniref:Nicotinate-nucleotide pyrophosphorylase [carboxylating] n=1 Tax=Litorihabitans aurantiacus TaxID=1930061 RepID=A0AA37XF09_9MICO|nr:carboxylating nicotinate-nucleotide diphosphorylase [Litorihabitans aurantiacus]GMA32016.1 nicotinate-nucleotide diphosphorylase (carboxylating) [Litorihabitans aurantiacus]
MLTAAAIDAVVRLALAEDAPHGDLTAAAFVPAAARADAVVRAREAGVMACGDVVAAVMRAVDPAVCVTEVLPDGEAFAPGDVLARIAGPARAVLTGERVMLNLLARMVAVATRTAAYVAEVDGALSARGRVVRVVDTRKTTPGLRALEKHAVVCGGGHNHRFSLSDAVMVKDNHLTTHPAGEITRALREAADRLPHTTHLEVEVDRLDQVEPVLASGVVGTIMLDNFSLEDLRAGVAQVAGRALVEASGGVTLASIGAIARTGVDLVSVGALTHGAGSVDLGLDIDVTSPTADGV